MADICKTGVFSGRVYEGHFTTDYTTKRDVCVPAKEGEAAPETAKRLEARAKEMVANNAERRKYFGGIYDVKFEGFAKVTLSKNLQSLGYGVMAGNYIGVGCIGIAMLAAGAGVLAIPIIAAGFGAAAYSVGRGVYIMLT